MACRHLAVLLVLSLVVASARPAHATSAERRPVFLPGDLMWGGISIRGTFASQGVQLGPAIELGVHPVQASSTLGSPAWEGDLGETLPNHCAVSMTAWTTRWGPGPDQHGIDLAVHNFRRLDMDSYTPRVTFVVGWSKQEEQHLGRIGGRLSAGLPLTDPATPTGIVWPQAGVGVGFFFWASDGGAVRPYGELDLATRLIRRSTGAPRK